jgi:hypothetical protein
MSKIVCIISVKIHGNKISQIFPIDLDEYFIMQKPLINGLKLNVYFHDETLAVNIKDVSLVFEEYFDNFDFLAQFIQPYNLRISLLESYREILLECNFKQEIYKEYPESTLVCVYINKLGIKDFTNVENHYYSIIIDYVKNKPKLEIVFGVKDLYSVDSVESIKCLLEDVVIVKSDKIDLYNKFRKYLQTGFTDCPIKYILRAIAADKGTDVINLTG